MPEALENIVKEITHKQPPPEKKPTETKNTATRLNLNSSGVDIFK